MKQFEALRTKAASIGPLFKGSLADKVDQVLDLARINADDTPGDDWDTIAMGTVCEVLCSCEVDAATQRWFRKEGVVW